MTDLGRMYADGLGTEQDYEEAARWLEKSADAGYKYAQYTLGKAYLLGQDIPQDQEQAVRWLKLSAEQGSQYAKYFLDQVYGSLFSSTVSLLYHMGRIFQEQRPQPMAGARLAVDSKLRAQDTKARFRHPENHPLQNRRGKDECGKDQPDHGAPAPFRCLSLYWAAPARLPARAATNAMGIKISSAILV